MRVLLLFAFTPQLIHQLQARIPWFGCTCMRLVGQISNPSSSLQAVFDVVSGDSRAAQWALLGLVIRCGHSS